MHLAAAGEQAPRGEAVARRAGAEVEVEGGLAAVATWTVAVGRAAGVGGSAVVTEGAEASREQAAAAVVVEGGAVLPVGAEEGGGCCRRRRRRRGGCRQRRGLMLLLLLLLLRLHMLRWRQLARQRPRLTPCPKRLAALPETLVALHPAGHFIPPHHERLLHPKLLHRHPKLLYRHRKGLLGWEPIREQLALNLLQRE